MEDKLKEKQPKDHYHHGNLKQALIDNGIRIFNQEGEDALSLRKVAAACGVSHAAPYAHFKDKEELIAAMKRSVTDQFSSELTSVIGELTPEDLEGRIVALGRAYVRFFIAHPDYYRFLFFGQKIVVHLGASDDYSEDYPPYKIFRDLFEKYIATLKEKPTDKEKEILLLRAWIVVQGLSSIVCMENVHPGRPWEEYLSDLII